MLLILDKLCTGFILYSLVKSSPVMALSLEPLGFNCAYPAEEKVSFVNDHDYCELEGEICDSYAHLFIMRQLLF